MDSPLGVHSSDDNYVQSLQIVLVSRQIHLAVSNQIQMFWGHLPWQVLSLYRNCYCICVFCIWATWGDIPWQEEVYKYASKSGLAKFPSASIKIPVLNKSILLFPNKSKCFGSVARDVGWPSLAGGSPRSALLTTPLNCSPLYAQIFFQNSYKYALLYMHKFLQICWRRPTDRANIGQRAICLFES